VDQADRDRAVSELGSSLMVEAGAGTGKTTVLLDRVMKILHTEVPLERLAIITFTEKAAGELKLRLRQRIEDLIRRSAGAPGPWLDHLRRSLESLDRATVSTIHAFAASLLRERPVEARADPRFVVADELQATLLREETWDRWLEQQMTQGAVPLARALRLGLRPVQIQELAWSLVEQRDVGLPPPPPAGQGDPAGVRGVIVAIIAKLGALSASCRDEEDKGLLQIRDLLAAVPGLEDAEGDRLVLLLERLAVRANAGSQAGWSSPQDLKQVKDLFRELAALRDEAVARARTAFAHELAGWLRDGFVQAWQEAKLARRQLDFSDLLILCRDMLRDSEAARAAFQDRFDCILVDEFQDTDPLQAEIVFLLASGDSAPSDWRQASPVSGKLFVVGDPKQSIYRFRRADIEIYQEVKSLIQRAAKPGAPPQPRLTQNFRTVPSIAAWVNDLFSRLMPLSDRRWQPDHEPLSAFREEPDGAGPRVVLLEGDAPPPGEEASAADRRRQEARAVASLLHAAHAGTWPGGQKGRRPRLAWRGMALLFRTTTALDAYEEALRDAGIPYHLTGGKRYYLRAEMRALQAVIEAIENPHDPLAVVSALRSPIFGHSDEDLLAHAAARREWTHTKEGAAPGTPFERSFELLARLHAQRNTRPIASTLEDLLDSSGALSLFYLKPDGDQRAANLLKAVDLARRYDAGGDGSFRAFVRWLSGMATDQREEGEAPLAEDLELDPDPETGEDGAVRLLTVHKAKGLEYPLVVLCDPGGKGRSGFPGWIVERGPAGEQAGAPRMEFCLGNAERRFGSTGYAAALEREKARLEAESHRLLYVALTRARDWLVVPVFGAASPQGSLKILQENGFLPQPGATLHRGARVVAARSLPEAPRESRTFRLGREEPGGREPSLIAEKEAWRRALKSALEAPVGGRFFRTASDLEGRPQAPAAVRRGAAIGDSPGAREARALGVAVHAVLERIDLATGRDIGLLSEEAAAAAGRPAIAPEVRRLVERALGSRILKEALAAPRCYRELPFVLAGETFLSEGRCDLVYESGGSLTVVDFKTDAVFTPEEIDARTELYRPQALVYARALAQITRLAVSRVVLLFVRADQERTFRVDENFLRQGLILLESGATGGSRDG
jgi:ATP-dependent exoDNAse (exonuclease V) beta subunit